MIQELLATFYPRVQFDQDRIGTLTEHDISERHRTAQRIDKDEESRPEDSWEGGLSTGTLFSPLNSHKTEKSTKTLNDNFLNQVHLQSRFSPIRNSLVARISACQVYTSTRGTGVQFSVAEFLFWLVRFSCISCHWDAIVRCISKLENWGRYRSVFFWLYCETGRSTGAAEWSHYLCDIRTIAALKAPYHLVSSAYKAMCPKIIVR